MNWDFGIQDLMSSPLAKIGASLDGVTKNIKTTETALAEFERKAKLDSIAKESDPFKKQQMSLSLYRDDLKKHQHALEENQSAASASAGGAMGFVGALAEVGTFAIQAGQAVAGVAEKIITLGVSFISTGLDAASFKRDTMLALEALTGTEAAAASAYTAVGKLAENSKYTREQIAGVYRELASYKGLTENNVTSITSAALSVGATQGDAAKQKLLAAIESAEGQGKFDTRSLNELKGVGVVSPEQLQGYLAEKNHTNVAGIKQMLDAGRITASEGVTAILELVKRDVDKGGELGAMSKKIAGGDADTQLKNIKEDINKLFEGAMTSGPMVDALGKIRGLLDPTTESGQKAQEVLGKMFASISTAIAGIDWDKVQVGFDKFVNGASRAWDLTTKFVGVFWDRFAPALDRAGASLEKVFGGQNTDGVDRMMQVVGGLGDVIGVVAGASLDQLMAMITYFAKGASEVSKFIDEVKAAPGRIGAFIGEFVSVGTSLVDGLWEGITGAWRGMLSKFDALVQQLPASVKSILGIHSPSRVMMGLGQYTAEGFAEGVESGPRPDLGSLMPSVNIHSFGSGDMARAGLNGSSFVMGDTVVHVYVDGASVADEDLAHKIAAEAAKQVRAQTRAEIVRFMDGLANEEGV